MNYDFELADPIRLSLESIGNEREPVLIVEQPIRNPEALVDYAARMVTFAPAGGPSGGYPGIRAPAPLNYVETLVKALDKPMRRAFGLSQVKLARAECSLSLVTLRPDQLAPFQRIPHVDTVDPLQFALLHYLCPPELGGTAFYRHRATGFETLTAERQQEYEAVRDRELSRPKAASYITGSTEHYDQVRAFEARFNRVIVYRSRTFHSGQIPEGPVLDADPRRGRLTANIFVNYKPA